MLSNQQADLLLSIPKHIVEGEAKLDMKELNEPILWDERFTLIGEHEEDVYIFIWELWQSSKNLLKLSLHHQDDETKTGILRIDFNGRHINPAVLADFVPAKFRPFVGKHFSTNEHHVHYHVDGYGPLAWALPITNDNFPLKTISRQNIVEIIEEFGNTINLQTKLFFNRRLL